MRRRYAPTYAPTLPESYPPTYATQPPSTSKPPTAAYFIALSEDQYPPSPLCEPINGEFEHVSSVSDAYHCCQSEDGCCGDDGCAEQSDACGYRFVCGRWTENSTYVRRRRNPPS